MALTQFPTVPLPTGPLVGRQHELEQLTTMVMNPASRLITISGPGGVGKTRLAQRHVMGRQSKSPTVQR